MPSKLSAYELAEPDGYIEFRHGTEIPPHIMREVEMVHTVRVPVAGGCRWYKAGYRVREIERKLLDTSNAH